MTVQQLINLLRCYDGRMPIIVHINGIATGQIEGLTWSNEIGECIVINAKENFLSLSHKSHKK